MEEQVRKFITYRAVMGNREHKQVHITGPAREVEGMQLDEDTVKKAKEVLTAYNKKNKGKKETQEEWSARCFENSLCFNCEKPGHQSRDCPQRRRSGGRGRERDDGRDDRKNERRDERKDDRDNRDRSNERKKDKHPRKDREGRWRKTERSSSSSGEERGRVHLLSSIKDYQAEELITSTCKEDIISDSSN